MSDSPLYFTDFFDSRGRLVVALFHTAESAYDLMQETAPGPYTLAEAYNTHTGKFDFQIMFENEQHKTMWILKNLSNYGY